MIVKINNKKYDFFSSITVNLSYNSFASTFGITAFFDPEDDDHKSLFRPLRYSKVEIEHNNETLLTGRKLNPRFKSSSSPNLATLSGYSLTGVLEDSSIPISVYPLQSDGLSLKEIAEKILKPFDIAVVVDLAVKDRANEVYESSDGKVDGTVKDYLTELATQKSIILSHTSGGALLLTEVKANTRPIADLSDALEKTMSVSGQKLHSSITALKEASLDGGNAGEKELDNPIIDSFRPRVITQTSGNDNDTELAAIKARASELSAIKLVIKLDSWIVNNRVIKPNQVISVKDPNIFLFKKTNWFIESVSLSGNAESETAVLNCVPPEVYNGKPPVNIFE